MRYRFSFDVFALIEKSRGELAEAAPEQFKIFLPAIMAGLRRNEVDKLEWPAFRWKDGVIRTEATKWFHPKSEDSLGDVEVDGEVMELFRGYRAKATGTFVVESKVTPRPEATFEHYRCESHFELTAGCRCSARPSSQPRCDDWPFRKCCGCRDKHGESLGAHFKLDPQAFSNCDG